MEQLGLTSAVMRSLGLDKQEANDIINEQARHCVSLILDGRLEYDDVEDALRDMGLEPDYIEDFLFRI